MTNTTIEIVKPIWKNLEYPTTVTVLFSKLTRQDKQDYRISKKGKRYRRIRRFMFGIVNKEESVEGVIWRLYY